MIRPYLAILRDSFREAMASRILWLVVLSITVVLAVFACLDVVRQASWKFIAADFPAPGQLIQQMLDASENIEPSVPKHVWQLLPADDQTELADLIRPRDTDGSPSPGGRGAMREELAGAFNTILEDPELYDEQVWSGVNLPQHIRAALGQPRRLSRDELAEHNRKLLETAFSTYIEPSAGSHYYVAFLTWEIPISVARTPDEMRRYVNEQLVQIIELFLGFVGVFVAILVTSSMIPRTFEPGAIDLLLSKPITRPLLYLTKFAGGCAFIVLSAAYFLVGVWLIAGLRVGVWNSGVLRCIYVFLFLFAIYYSVSALVGVIWRNSILSVAAVVVFWFVTVLIGQVHVIMNLFWLQPSRMESLEASDGQLWGLSKNRAVKVWDNGSSQWKTVLASSATTARDFLSAGDPVTEPVYDKATGRLFALPSDSEFQTPQLAWGTPNDEYRSLGAKVPLGRALFRKQDGDLLAVGPNGIYQLSGDLTEPPKEPAPLTIMGRRIPLPIQLPQSRKYKSVGPVPAPELASDFTVDYDAASNQLAMHSHGQVFLLHSQDDQSFQVSTQVMLPHDDRAAIAIGGQNIAVADDDSRVTLLSTRDLQPVHTWETDQSRADRISASSDGRWFAIEWSGGHVSLLEASAQEFHDEHLPSQGHLTAATFAGRDRLLIADERNRIIQYQLDGGSHRMLHIPRVSTLERVYYYAIRPLYVVFPRPGELSVWTMALVTGETTVVTEANGRQITIETDMWSAIWSCAAFTAVMLVAGCLFVWRRDF